MRIISLLVFIFCFQVLCFAQNNIDVLHYKFNIGLNDVNDNIIGVAEITLAIPKYESVYLDLHGLDANGKGMSIDSVLVNRHGRNFFIPNSDTINIFYKHAGNKLSIISRRDKIDAAQERLRLKDTFKVLIHYHGIPTDGLIISKTKYGHRSFFADNWPNRGHNWIPCHDDPADKATVEFVVTAPEHYQVVANGVQIEETSLGNSFKLTHWKEDTPISTKVMVIGAADFAVNLAGVVNGNIPVYSWVYPEDKDKGFYDYALANGILEYYISHVGPYGYKKLANVQSKTRFGGLENANTIFYSENSVSGTRKSEGLLAHEIAHQWFGNMATEKSFGHLWLSEGFATYFTILYFENKYGKDTAIKMLKEDRDQVIAYSKESKRAVVDTEETDYMKLLNPNSYPKGGWVLHMLRSELGDSVFWRSIRKYYATYAGGVADTRDLQKVFEDVSGKNLKQFFDQWLYTTGQPQLDITWSYDATGKFINVNIKQQQKNIFNFPLSLKINSSRAGKKEKVFVDKAVSSFKIKADQKPTSIIVDPDTELLMQSSIKEK
jgi:aminopeptidase N